MIQKVEEKELKAFEKEINKKSTKTLSQILVDYRIYIIMFVIYIFGVIFASVCYKYIGSYAKDFLKETLLSEASKSVLHIFLNDICVYFSVYAITLVFGLCSIGTPIVCFVPLFNGFIVSLEINYLYSNYGVKGIGYSLLLIIPAATLFTTLIFITMNESIKMSKSIFDSAFKDKKTAKIDVTKYLKKFAVYGIIIIVISLIDSALTSMISTVVSLA